MKITTLICALFVSATIAKGNLTITSGGTYSPQITGSGKLVTVNTTAAVTIQYANLTMTGDNSIAIWCGPGSQVRIENCDFSCTAPTPSTCSSVNSWEAGSLYVANCDFNQGEGVIMQADGTGTTASYSVIQNAFNNCYCCMQWAGIRNDPNCVAYYNQCTGDGSQLVTDQISVYNSSGVYSPWQPISIRWNFIEVYSDQNVLLYAGGIVCGDGPSGSPSLYEDVEYNTIENNGITSANPNDVVTITGNTVIGLGYKLGFSAGMGGYSGVCSGNESGFWARDPDQLSDVLESGGYTGMDLKTEVVREPKSWITLQHEKDFYSDWLTDIGVSVGTGTPPGPTWLPSSDFNF